MKHSERALQDLQRWVDKTGTGLQVGYTRVAPTVIDNVPHPWMCEAGRYDREYFAGYGVTMEAAILACWQKWDQQQEDTSKPYPTVDCSLNRAERRHPECYGIPGPAQKR